MSESGVEPTLVFSSVGEVPPVCRSERLFNSIAGIYGGVFDRELCVQFPAKKHIVLDAPKSTEDEVAGLLPTLREVAQRRPRVRRTARVISYGGSMSQRLKPSVWTSSADQTRATMLRRKKILVP